jgi:hypothetical protein
MKTKPSIVASLLLSSSVLLAAPVRVERLPTAGAEAGTDAAPANPPAITVAPTASVRSAPVVQRSSRERFSQRSERFNPNRYEHRQVSVQPLSRSYEPVMATSYRQRTRVVRQIGAPVSHGAIVRNRDVVRRIETDRRVEVVPNRYYWHSVGGQRYAHYYRGGHHWWGFYSGPHFYWTRYHRNHWWWYDPGFHRWAFWASGYWWWPGPGGALYVNVNDAYVPYSPGVVAVTAPEAPAPPTETVDAPTRDTTLNSPDSRRSVQIVGGQAFLYDTTSGKPVFMKFLANNVERVRFSGGTDGKPLQILLDFSDGRFTLYTSDGLPSDDSATASSEDGAEAPPEPPPVVSE